MTADVDKYRRALIVGPTPDKTNVTKYRRAVIVGPPPTANVDKYRRAMIVRPNQPAPPTNWNQTNWF